jgi:hypothetical protein
MDSSMIIQPLTSAFGLTSIQLWYYSHLGPDRRWRRSSSSSSFDFERRGDGANGRGVYREQGREGRWNEDISVPHLVRTVPRFVDEEERAGGKASTAQPRPVTDSSVTKERHPESVAAEATKPKARVTYQVSEQPSSRVQEEEFAKQLRLARYLAAANLPPSRPIEPVRQPRTPKQERPIAKAGAKTKGESARQKAGEAELAKERRRLGRWVGTKHHHPVQVVVKSTDLDRAVEVQTRKAVEHHQMFLERSRIEIKWGMKAPA